ncbi:hypothetical protein N7512_000302 [Penicillium capsulatum]|nr:hypothetical protein N7512_000302 [Penicillium capsulatum]
MSLGFTFGSFGDFVALVELANKIRKEFLDAPTEFANIAAELRSLAILLQDLEIKLSGHRLDANQQASLAEHSANCQKVLQDLQKKVQKCHSLEYSGHEFGKQAKKVWQRFKWDPEDAKELRQRITSNITMLNAFQSQLSSQTTFETRQGVDQLNRRQNDKERVRVLDWLSKVDYALQQSDFMGRRQPGTGEWLLNSDEYAQWHQSPGQALFCPGMPGAGKTICTAIVINDLNNRFNGQKDVGIAYIYCNFRRREDQRLEDLLLNLLKQLSQTRDSLPADVKALFAVHQEKRTRPLFEEILRTLHLVSNMFRRVFLVVDALDECQADDGCQARLVSQLLKLQSECGANVFATSRFTEIVEIFRGAPSLEIRAVEEDVRKYLDGNLIRLPGFVRRNPDLQEEIRSTIVRLVRGMSAKAVRTALARLPTGADDSVYDQAYKDAMRRIYGQLNDQKDLALQALSWITCAKRPLTSLELLHALAIEEGEPQLDEDNLPEIEDILTVCAGLVTTEDESGIVRLVHYTTQEFFERTQKDWFPNVESEITLHCVTYLSFEVFTSPIFEIDGTLQERLASNPLFDYSARYWGIHARSTSPLDTAVFQFLASSTNVAAAGQALLAGGPTYSQEEGNILDGLHLAAYFGLLEAVAALISDGHPVDVRDTRGCTPLIWSAQRGHEDITRYLLEKGAEIEKHDRLGLTPLACAAEKGHDAVTQLLIEWGANVNTKDFIDRSPLSLAASHGNEAICRMLLKEGAAVEVTGYRGWTPLMFASASGHESVTKLLIDQGGDIHAKDIHELTPLLTAVKAGHLSTCRMLLERGSNMETRDLDGWTALLQASASGHENAIEFLINQGADIEARDAHDRTAVILAARMSQPKAVQVLVNHGADTEARDLDGRTALFWAAENSLESSIQLLLDKHIQARSPDGTKDIALKVASLGGVSDRFWHALEHTTNLDSYDDTFGTALQCASSKGYQNFVQVLVDKGANVNACGGPYGTALQAASRRGHRGIVLLLLDNNADINLQDEKGLTALHAASAEGYVEIAQLLLDRNATPSLQDNSGETALQAGSREGQLLVVDLLLEHVADIDLGGETRDSIRSDAIANDGWDMDFDDV